MNKRTKFTSIAVTLGTVTVEGFKNVAQAEAFHEEMKKATLKAFRKVTDMPKELDPETFDAMPAEVVGMLTGSEGSEAIEITLSELDGSVKLRKVGETTTNEDATQDETTPDDETSDDSETEMDPEPESEKAHGKRGRKATDTE